MASETTPPAQPEAGTEPRKCRAVKRGGVDLQCTLPEDHPCRLHKPGTCPPDCTGGWHHAVCTESREIAYDGARHAVSIIETVIWEPVDHAAEAARRIMSAVRRDS